MPTSIDEAVENYTESAGKFPEVLRITSSIDNFNKMVREVKPLLEKVAERYPLPWNGLSNEEIEEMQGYSLTTFSNVYGSIYDKSGNLKAEIIDNEWVSGNPKPWDIEASYQFLKIRHKKRRKSI